MTAVCDTPYILQRFVILAALVGSFHFFGLKADIHVKTSDAAFPNRSSRAVVNVSMNTKKNDTFISSAVPLDAVVVDV